VGDHGGGAAFCLANNIHMKAGGIPKIQQGRKAECITASFGTQLLAKMIYNFTGLIVLRAT
jgi:hypothetical protein